MTGAARRALAAGAVLTLLSLPLLTFLWNVSPFAPYLGDGLPPGQPAYIMMRPAGHLAFVLLFLQILLGRFGGPLARWLALPSLLPLHKRAAVPVLAFAFLHPLLFAQACRLRLEMTWAGALRHAFLPDPSGNVLTFYFFFGALTLYALLAAVLAAVLGPRLLGRAWRLIHGMSYLAFLTGWYHATAIGAEVREQPLGALYTLMAAAVAGILIERLARFPGQHRRPSGAPGSAGRPRETAAV